MKSVRKSVSLVLALCMIASAALAGCGNTPAASSAAAPAAAASTAEASSAASEAPKEEVKLTFWTCGTAQDQQARVVDAINKYLKETLKSNIQIDYQELGWGDDMTQKVNNALSTGQSLDVVFTGNWIANVKQNALAGNFEDLGPYLEKYPEIKKLLGDQFIKASQINGKTYALPTNKEKFHNWGYLLKKDLVDKYKIDVKSIKSEKDLEPWFDKILKGEPGITPLAVAQMDIPGVKFLDWDIVSDDDVPGAFYPSEDPSKSTIVNQYVAPEMVDFYKNMKTYLAKKYIKADAITSPGLTNEMQTGKYFAAVSQLKPGKDGEMSASTGVEWVQAEVTAPHITNRETTGSMLAIPKQSKHKEEAMQFINLLYTDANLLNFLVYGEEGKDYTKGSDGKITLTKGSGYASGNGWRWGDQTKTYLLANEANDKYEQWKKLDSSLKPLQSYGFIFTNQDSDIQTITANTKAVTQEYYKGLFMGQAKDVDATVKQMDAKYKAAGVDKLLKTMQSEYDAWKAAKK